MLEATVTARGALRWASGHPWIFRSDVSERPAGAAGVARVRDSRGKWLGVALWSPLSEISLRLIDGDPDATIDEAWWRRRLERAVARRSNLGDVATAYRLVHGEGDLLPSLVCDRYGDTLVVQLLSAGVETFRSGISAALLDLTGATGILARNDPPVRAREGLPREVSVLAGTVPDEVEVAEYGVRYLVAPRTGQKTGAFLDQRENRSLAGSIAGGGRALDCFSYHGSFALHLSRRVASVVAVDSSGEALARARRNAALNGLSNIDFVEGNAFDLLREWERAGERFDTIVVDPPAFARNSASVGSALRGYHEINLRAMRLLAPGGALFTASCSYHVRKHLFLDMLTGAAQDSGRQLTLRAITGQPADHPELITVPETGYLKGAVLVAVD
ncbi:MAG: class I SAM-dependent rRNA methyltransferase [Gemmatimonadota bacterium]